MRFAWLLVIGCSGSPSPPPETAEPPPPPRVAKATVDAAVDGTPIDPDDPDRDTIRGACDLCPNEPETWNGIVDEDGCPDTSGLSHAVLEDPTNRYAWPTQVRFAGDQPAAAIDATRFDDGIEVIDVIARSNVSVKPQVASRRAAAVAKLLRKHVLQSVRVNERVTGAVEMIVDDDVIVDPKTDVAIVVMRARTVDIWKWQDDHLVRATPRARLPEPALPPGCR